MKQLSNPCTPLRRLTQALGRILIGAALMAAIPAALGQGTITLRSLARIAPGRAITLGDIADLSGPDAESQRGLVMAGGVSTGGPSLKIDLAAVRTALESQTRINLGRMVLSGGQCIVRAVAPEAAPTIRPAPAQAVPAPRGETVKDRVAARIASVLAADPSDLKLTFEDQPDLLATPTAGRTIAVQPAAMSDKIPLQVRVYEGDTIIAQGTVRVGVLVRRDVVVSHASLARASIATADLVEADRQWVAPTLVPATMAQVVNSIVRAHIEVGRVIMEKDVEPPLIVKRGDLISVDCISGTVIVGTTARAREPGRDGQVIELQALQSKKSFRARINGLGRAVLVTGNE